MATSHGGRRPNSGRKPKAAGAKAKTTKVNQPAEVKAAKTKPLFDLSAIERIIEASNARRRIRSDPGTQSPFKPYIHPKAAMPPKALQMATDEALNWASTEWASGLLASTSAEGLIFLGYPYLSELAQRPEYRVISETIATEMTRKWIKFKGTGDEDKTDRIKELVDFMDHLRVQDRFADMAIGDGFFGRMHLYLDSGATDEENKTPIGTGRDKVTESKVGEGFLKALKSVEPVWTYPTTYNATNPLSADWYNPQVWYTMGREIHRSRLLPFIGRPVPDMLKPAYSFGGLSLSQMAMPYVDIWLNTRESVASLIKAFSVMVLSTDMGATMEQGGAGGLMARATLATVLRDNQGLQVINKNTEDFKNVSAPIGGLHELQAQAQEHMMSVARIPQVKFTGLSPAGLNASSEGELQAFDDTIAAYQNRFFRPNLNTVVDMAMITLWGARDPEITYDFEPLRQMTEKERGEIKKQDAEVDQLRIDTGVVSPGEVRKKVVDDPDSDYHGLDPEDVPDLSQEEEQGLEPRGAGGGRGGTGGGDDDEGGPGAEDANILPFGLAADDFNEADHPRGQPGNAGQFGAGGGGSSGKGSTGKRTTGERREAAGASGGAPDPLKVAGLKKVGKQMGSNPGGVYEDTEGQRFYIKAGQSKDHVRNELAAAALYQLAGAPTLKYRPVEGGEHIATEMEPLGKNRVQDFSPAELKAAQEDFAVHAWLANWDAVGLVGDNQGTVKGTPTSLDLGGALAYRAQGGPKGAAFGDKVGELDTLRNAEMNPIAAKVFGSMTPAELKASAAKVTGIPDADIRKTVAASGEKPALAVKLIARKNDIAKRFGGQAGDEFNPSDHPHAPAGTSEGGQFVSAGGTTGSSVTSKAENAKFEYANFEEYKDIVGGSYNDYIAHQAEAKKANSPATFKSKKDHVAHLLMQGTTAAEILKATGWPSVSVPAQAKAAGLKLTKTTEGGKTIYKGVPLTDEEKASAKAEAKAAATKPKAQTPAPSPAPTPAASTVKSKPPQASPEDLKKAAKSTNVPVPSGYSPEAQKQVGEFNKKYGNGTPTLTGEALNQKVADFKALQASTAAANAAHQEKQAAAQKEANEKAAVALKKAQAESKAKLQQHMKDLGISETEATGFEALVSMLGGKSKDIVEKFKEYQKQAESHGYPISGFQYALIRNYINGGYIAVNEALRQGTLTAAQHVYTRMVNNALDKLPKYTGTVERGTSLSAEEIASYKPGHVKEERGFTSTGIGYKFGGNVNYHIQSIGKRGADFSQGANPTEKEVLFKAHTFFLVHKVETKGGTTHIHMEEVEGHG